MKVLGVLPSTTGVLWAVLEGSRKRPTLVTLDTKGQKLPADEDQTQKLHKLKNLVVAFLNERKIEKVCIVVSGPLRHGGAPSLRPKVEAIVQIAAAERAIPVELVQPASLRAKEKKFAEITGDETPEACLNAGDPFVPQDFKEAVLVGWLGLGE